MQKYLRDISSCVFGKSTEGYKKGFFWGFFLFEVLKVIGLCKPITPVTCLAVLHLFPFLFHKLSCKLAIIRQSNQCFQYVIKEKRFHCQHVLFTITRML